DLAPVDGRTLRALRTRESIVDATIAQIDDGDLRPTAPRVAALAGVSVRTVFQHFAVLEALHAAGAERLAARLAALVLPMRSDMQDFAGLAYLHAAGAERAAARLAAVVVLSGDGQPLE